LATQLHPDRVPSEAANPSRQIGLDRTTQKQKRTAINATLNHIRRFIYVPRFIHASCRAYHMPRDRALGRAPVRKRAASFAGDDIYLGGISLIKRLARDSDRSHYERTLIFGWNGSCQMKLFLTSLILLGLSLAASPSTAADSRNISVVNETGYAIKFLGFNGPDDGLDEWDNELEGILKNQQSTYVEFDDDDEGCVWNVKVVWADYDEAVLWKNVNLCKFTALRLRYDSGTKTTSFVAE
jgi:hypothetical protein